MVIEYVTGFRSLCRIWESVQVELQGRYSMERLREVTTHAKTSTAVGNVATALLTPIPALLLILFYDILPLRPASAGLYNQTVGTFLRVSSISFLGLQVAAQQTRQCVPSLPMSTFQHLCASTITAVVSLMVFCAQAALWVFPTPFSIVIAEPSFVLPTIACAWWTWKDSLRNNSDLKATFLRYLKVLTVQFSLIGGYVSYYALFSIVGKTYQPYLSILLPILKMAFKNMARSGLYYIEDLAPAVVVSNIDVFHMTFVCSTVQQTQGRAAIVFIMLVDLAQSLVAYFEVCEIVRGVNIIAEESQEADKYTKSNSRRFNSRHTSSRLASALKMRIGVIDYALYLVNKYPQIRDHPTISSPRHLRQPLDSAPLTNATRNVSHRSPTTMVLTTSTKITPFNDTDTTKTVTQATTESRALLGIAPPFTAPELSQSEQSQLACVEAMVKLLHMIWQQLTLETLVVINAWRNGMADPDRAWTKQQAAVVHAASCHRVLDTLLFRLTSQPDTPTYTASLIAKIHGLIDQDLDSSILPPCTAPTMRVLFFAGTSPGNPGPGGAGAVIALVSRAGFVPEILWSSTVSIPDPTTNNNHATYNGILEGLQAAHAYGWRDLIVIGTCGLVLRQLREYRAPKDERLRLLYHRARRLADMVGVTLWHHQVKNHNTMAVTMASHAMDTALTSRVLHPTDRICHADLPQLAASDLQPWLTSQVDPR